MTAARSLGAVCITFALAADQISKSAATAYSDTLTGGIPVVPGFNLIFLRNDGVTFGMLGGAPWWALSGPALAIIVWLGILLARTGSRVDAAAYGLVIGGALGNVTDRLRFGGVSDFLDIYVGAWHWPAFNLADVAVVGGVGLLLLSELWRSRRQRPVKS
ncbi:MAG TPA: signal peptidase II [Aurantimonas coralicida]|uniref:Lipoprotein signal peptidase n=2 Tax=root TaxID=1 RepID=A0A9C9TJL3_9HYPH|nr:signal peptidase II [Aurantimonas coralicida]HEU02973.1 signal peptidase II [Aurantimonas coralicida]